MKIFWMLLIAAAVSPAAEWKQLFNHRDTTAWKMVGPGGFVVEDGMLKTEGGMGLLWYTVEKFGGATIRVVFKTATEHANSGLYIRLAEPPKIPGTPSTMATKSRSTLAAMNGTAPAPSTR